MTASLAGTPDIRRSLDRLLGELRPKLHRYCARMTGSVIDGEDVVQEALMKAIEALPRLSVEHPEAWLFRIAHNAALDFLRRRARHDAVRSDQDPELVADPAATIDARYSAAASLRTFMRLPAAQRSCVILMDVLGYSVQEISAVMDASIPAVKASLHRGRTRLRDLAREPEETLLPVLGEPERSRLTAYVDRFNAGDFDAIRDMLAEEVRLELVNHTRLHGRVEVGRYFSNYARAKTSWRLVPGLVDGRPAVLAREAGDPMGPPANFILLEWAQEQILGIRDFLYARYASESAAFFIPT
jgi:RNA polymerase sigma-70 factor (ECF subfamily)